jgi:hypothetical protein
MKVLNKEFRKRLKEISFSEFNFTKKDGEINLHDVRCMFDQLITEFGDDYAYYFSENSTIFNNPEFKKSNC